MRRWTTTATLIACIATACEARDREPTSEPLGEGGVCELPEPPDVVMRAGGIEHIGLDAFSCITNFGQGCAQCSQGQGPAPPYGKIAPGDAISFSMAAGAFVPRERCTRGDCSTMLVLDRPDAGEVMTLEVDEDVPVPLDISPGIYFADLNVIYEADDGSYHGAFTARFGLIVQADESN